MAFACTDELLQWPSLHAHTKIEHQSNMVRLREIGNFQREDDTRQGLGAWDWIGHEGKFDAEWIAGMLAI